MHGHISAQKACTIGYGTNLDAHPRYIPYDDVRRMARQGILSGATLKTALLKRGMVWSEQQAEAAMREELGEYRRSLPGVASSIASWLKSMTAKGGKSC